jgi:hypothetical protein
MSLSGRMRFLYRRRNRKAVTELFSLRRVDAATDYAMDLRSKGILTQTARRLAIHKFKT